MHTLSIFPRLLDFALISPFIIRIVVSIFIMHLGKKRSTSEYKWLSVLYYVVGGFIFVGLYTQIAVLVGIAVLKTDFYLDYWKNRNTVPVLKQTYYLYILAEIILLSLIFTGPGIFAVDYPL